MGQREQLFNILSVVMLGLTLLVIIYYIIIALNPYTVLNPFQPDKRIIAVVATATATPLPPNSGLPTWTPTTTPTITPTPPPSFTPTTTLTPTPRPSPTPTPLPPTPTPRMTRSANPFTYELNYETPYYGCSWMGVAGIVENIDGEALKDYPIHVWGGGIDVVVNSGSKLSYGDSGWEQFFNNQPMEVNGVFRVQIHSPYGDHPPISEEIVLNFEESCAKSLAYITFTQNH